MVVCPPHQLRQLGDIGGDAPRLVANSLGLLDGPEFPFKLPFFPE
jgi:hypothetical protein